MRNIFNINEIFNLEFDQVSYLEPNVDAITDGYITPTGTLNLTISFNENTLPNASKEYIMATVYHEILHAILNRNNISPGQQHEPMATEYINVLAAALIEHFPSMPLNHAIRLSWGGLQDTAAWNNLSSFQQNNIINTNQNYKSLQSGTDCN